jgi:hypothetical protein
MKAHDILLDDIQHPPCIPPDLLVASLKSVGIIKPVVLVKEGDKYFASDDAPIIAAAKILKWKTIQAYIKISNSGYAKELFLIRLRGSLSQLDLGPGPVGKVLRAMCKEYIQQFGTEQDFIETAATTFHMPDKIIHQAMTEPDDKGINLPEFFSLLDDLKSGSKTRYKDRGLGNLRICPLCGWESEKSDAPKEILPAVIKTIIAKRLRHLLKGMGKRDQMTTISLISNDLKELVINIRL